MMCHRRGLASVIAVCFVLAAAAPALAGEEEAPEQQTSEASEDSEESEETFGEDLDEEITYSPRADSVILFDGEVEIPRPTGWNIQSPGDGAVALFHAASDDRAQIEVRVSSSIAESHWERFWRAFDTDLRQAGFSLDSSRTQQEYAQMRGLQFEYRLVQQGQDAYRLIVWHVHEEQRAWIFTAFFAESRRDAYMETFEELLESVEW